MAIVALKATEAQQIDATAHREGHAWADMAILCRHHSEMDLCDEVMRQRKLPHQVRRKSSSVFDPAHDSIKVMTLHVSKGLEFAVVALVGAGRMPAEGEDEREEARLFYVGATRARGTEVVQTFPSSSRCAHTTTAPKACCLRKPQLLQRYRYGSSIVVSELCFPSQEIKVCCERII